MNKLWRISLLTGCPFLVLCLCGIIALGSQKTVVINDANGNTATVFLEDLYSSGEMFRLPVVEEGEEAVIRVPVPASLNPDNLKMESSCFKQQIRLSFTDVEAVFFAGNSISAGKNTATEAKFMPEGHNTYLLIQLNDYFETESTLLDNCLEIRLIPPAEKYDKAVLLEIPAAEEYTEEQMEILKDTAAQLSVALETRGMKGYLLENDARAEQPRKRAEFANCTKADLYVGLGLNRDDNGSVTGTLVQCNDMYLPERSSVTAADLVEKSLTAALESWPRGVLRSGENLPDDLMIPAILVYPGYGTSAQEMDYLQNSGYRKLIAEGTAEGIAAFLADEKTNK